MVITYLKISDIKPYYQNAIAHKDDNLALATEMMRKFGFNQPIVVDEHKVIICGHGRLECAKRLEMIEVPCVVVTGFTEEDKRVYRIVDNIVYKSVSWDWTNLFQEFRELGIAHDLTIPCYQEELIRLLTK